MDEFSKHFLILYLFQGREQGCVCDNEAGTVELICHLMGACVGVWAWPLLLGGWRVVNVFCNCVFIFKESRLGNQLGNDGCSTHSPPPPCLPLLPPALGRRFSPLGRCCRCYWDPHSFIPRTRSIATNPPTTNTTKKSPPRTQEQH